MIQAKFKLLTFDELLKAYPEDGRYELVNGKIVRILAIGQHEDVANFVVDFLKEEVKSRRLNYVELTIDKILEAEG